MNATAVGGTRLRHFGSYGYSWEDAGSQPRRYATYRYRLLDGES